MSNNLLPQKFSDNAEENLRIENDIMKLKLQAEFGASHFSSGDLPPQIENIFLRQVERFEKEWNRQPLGFLTVYELLGKPKFTFAERLKPSDLNCELRRVIRMLDGKNIHVHFIGDYHPLLKYKFLTEEFFHLEIENISMPGWTRNFIYEEFQSEP